MLPGPPSGRPILQPRSRAAAVRLDPGPHGLSPGVHLRQPDALGEARPSLLPTGVLEAHPHQTATAQPRKARLAAKLAFSRRPPRAFGSSRVREDFPRLRPLPHIPSVFSLGARTVRRSNEPTPTNSERVSSRRDALVALMGARPRSPRTAWRDTKSTLLLGQRRSTTKLRALT